MFLIHFWYRNTLILIEADQYGDFEDRIVINNANIKTITPDDEFYPFDIHLDKLIIFKPNIFCIEELKE